VGHRPIISDRCARGTACAPSASSLLEEAPPLCVVHQLVAVLAADDEHAFWVREHF
jgi:hypothetical protein